MTFTEREVSLMSKLMEAAGKLIETDDAVVTVHAERKRYVARETAGVLQVTVGAWEAPELR